MPPILHKRGRPKGHEVTVIGLPTKKAKKSVSGAQSTDRRRKPLPFIKLHTFKVCDESILASFSGLHCLQYFERWRPGRSCHMQWHQVVSGRQKIDAQWVMSTVKFTSICWNNKLYWCLANALAFSPLTDISKMTPWPFIYCHHVAIPGIASFPGTEERRRSAWYTLFIHALNHHGILWQPSLCVHMLVTS